MKKYSFGAFTLIEMLVVISIIVVLAAFAGPAIFSALTKGQMTASVNNSRQLYLAGQQMALDGSTNSDPTRAWPGDLSDTPSGGGSAAPITTLQQYMTKLVQGDYLKAGDIQKILSAPGATCTATSDNSTNAVTLGGKSALKVYKIKETDPTNTVFAVTSNYTYNTALVATDAPYGDKGFVVQRKGGDASLLKKNNAVVVTGQESTFQSLVGKKPGEADGTVTAGDATVALTNP